MKKVRIEAFCDNHAEDEEVPAVIERTLTMDDSGPRLVDVCERCDRSLEQFRVLISRGTAPPEPVSVPRRKSGGRPALPLDCREPGCVDPRTGRQYVAPSRSALGAHVRDSHGKSLTDYDWSVPATT